MTQLELTTTNDHCPQCGSFLTFRFGYGGRFLACVDCKCEWDGRGIIRNGSRCVGEAESREEKP